MTIQAKREVGCVAGAVFMAALMCRAGVDGFPLDQPGKIRNPDALRPAPTVETPHTRWARDNAAGATKALFIAPRGALREVIELAQRMDRHRKGRGHGRGNLGESSGSLTVEHGAG